MRLWSRECSKIADAKAASEYHISLASLMENAGSAVAAEVDLHSPRKVVIFCGKGNNGGDGFVAARHLSNRCNVVVITVGDMSNFCGYSHENYLSLKAMDIPIYNNPSKDEIEQLLYGADVIVDAILGVGFKGQLDRAISTVVSLINEFKKNSENLIVIAVDIPTGVDADGISKSDQYISADVTVTFGRPKIGCYTYPGALASGEIVVDEIGMPSVLLEQGNTYVADEDAMAKLMPKRPVYSHKGDFGKVALVAGSRGMMGAAVLSCQAAMRSGCGMSYLISPETYYKEIEEDILHTVKIVAQSNSNGRLAGITDDIEKKINSCDVLAIGPGLGLDDDVICSVAKILACFDGPAVIDADAINAISIKPEILSERAALKSIITPHQMELSRLLKVDVEEIRSDMLKYARMASSNYGCITVLKGAHTIIAHPDQRVHINTTGNNGMATAGSGDVLTGIIASFVAQGVDLFDAARLGVYVHGISGDIAAVKLSEQCVVASDILKNLPYALEKTTQRI